jgi:hypothetical protein
MLDGLLKTFLTDDVGVLLKAFTSVYLNTKEEHLKKAEAIVNKFL